MRPPCAGAGRDASTSVTRLAANLVLLLAAAFWGFGNIAQKTVLEYIDPFSAAGARCLIAALLVMPFAFLRRQPRGAAYWASLARVSLLFSVSIGLQQYAYLEASVTNASFLVNTATVMTPLAAWLLFGEKPAPVVLLAAAGTMVGVLLIAGGLGKASSGDLFALLSAACYALWMVELGRHMQAHGDPIMAAGAQFLVAAVLMLPMGASRGNLSGATLLAAAPDLAILGVFSTAAAFGIQTVAQRFTSASHAAVIVSAESVFGAAGAAAFLGERLSVSGAAGAVIVLCAILLLAIQTAGAPAAGDVAGVRNSEG